MDMKALAAVIALLFGVVSATTSVDTEWMKTALRDHFSQARHHVTNPSYKAQAKDFILNEFKSYGLETHLQRFSTKLSTVNGTNVIGILRGSHFNTNDDRVIGVGAHYDTVRETPGVDDNGAAVVAMLQAAKHIAKYSRNYTVVFVAFDFEEYEVGSLPSVACSTALCGSIQFLTWVVSVGIWTQVPTVSGVIIMDTIMNIAETNDTQTIPTGFDQAFPNVVTSVNSDGRHGDFIAAIGRPYDSVVLDAFVNAYNALGQPEFEVEKIFIAQITGPTVTNSEAATYADLMRSDHYTFWKSGYPAIFLTDTANFRGYMRTCYHKACDQMSKVTDKMIQFAGKTTQAVIDTVNTLAPPTVTTTTPVPTLAPPTVTTTATIDNAATPKDTGCPGVNEISVVLLGGVMICHLIQRNSY